MVPTPWLLLALALVVALAAALMYGLWRGNRG